MSSIASRASWGARYRNGVGNRRVGSLQKYFHHTVTSHLSVNATVAQERAQMRTIENIGQQRFGAGIFYSFIIFPSGRIYEGASVNRIAYHSGPGRNTRGAGICLAGNYDTNQLGTRAFSAIVWLLQEGVRRGWWGDPALTERHRDFSSTACPGRHAAAQFAAINRAGRSGSTPPQVIPEKGQAAMATPNQIWSYSNPDVDERQVFRMLRNMAEDAWNYRGVDYLNDNPSTQAAKLSRTHQYSFQAPRRGWKYRGFDYVNNNPATKDAQSARTHQYAHQVRSEQRENHAETQAGLAALADQLEALKPGLAQAVKAAMAEARDEQVKITAADVAKELEVDAEVSVREAQEDEEQEG